MAETANQEEILGIQDEVADAAGLAESVESRSRSRRVAFALLALVVLLFVWIRWWLREMPLERDEGEYAYAGQLILQGIPPYELAYNMKFPGTYAAYAVIMLIFVQTIHAIHLGLLLVNVATIA